MPPAFRNQSIGARNEETSTRTQSDGQEDVATVDSLVDLHLHPYNRGSAGNRIPCLEIRRHRTWSFCVDQPRRLIRPIQESRHREKAHQKRCAASDSDAKRNFPVPRRMTFATSVAAIVMASAAPAQTAPPSYQADPYTYEVIFEDFNFRVIAATWKRARRTRLTLTHFRLLCIHLMTARFAFTIPTAQRGTSETRPRLLLRDQLQVPTPLKTSARLIVTRSSSSLSSSNGTTHRVLGGPSLLVSPERSVISSLAATSALHPTSPESACARRSLPQ